MSSTEENVCGSASGVAGTEARPADVLLALADRCEREEPSRELDNAIGDAFGLDRTVWRETTDIRCIYDHPRYTASLDAAVTLVEDDCTWSIDTFQSVLASVVGYDRPDPGYWDSRGKTPALALCAAALRARAALTKAGV